MHNNNNNLPQQLEQFRELEPAVQKKRLVKLKQDRDWYSACKQLVASPGWATLKERVGQVKTATAEQLISGQVEGSRMEVVAARIKSRLDMLDEIEQQATLFEKADEKLDLFKSNARL